MWCDDAGISGRTALANLLQIFAYATNGTGSLQICLVCSRRIIIAILASKQTQIKYTSTLTCVCVLVYCLEWGSFKKIYVHTHTSNYVNKYTHTRAHICIPHINSRQPILNQPLKFLCNSDCPYYNSAVTICTARFSTQQSHDLPTHTVFMCSVRISEQTAIISLYNIN
jgi:hypothetical protein